MARSWKQKRVQNVKCVCDQELHYWTADMVLESTWQAVIVSWLTKSAWLFFANSELWKCLRMSEITPAGLQLVRFVFWGHLWKDIANLWLPRKWWRKMIVFLTRQSIMYWFWTIHRPLWKECKPLVVTEELKRAILFQFSGGITSFLNYCSLL